METFFYVAVVLLLGYIGDRLRAIEKKMTKG